MADLMIRLAYGWKRQGALDRAEELARHANALLEAVGEEHLLRMSTLRAWAIFEMDRGELAHAANLVEFEVALARRWYEEVPDSPQLLIRALRLKAVVFEKLGRTRDAEAAQAEAERLEEKGSEAP
jgi:acyl-CoA reductase-like NAD-dependent aldehyde dehydrogenase